MKGSGAVSHPNVVDRIRQMRRLLATEGPSGVVRRLLDRAVERMSPLGYDELEIAREDLVAAGEIAASGWTLPGPAPMRAGQPLTVAWVSYPPGEGSGGHTTMFRMISALERAGHRCIIYLQDRHGWAIEQHEVTVRRVWPFVKAEVRSLDDGIEDAHAIFATGWQTAYPVLASPAKGTRFYLVQDFEPSFYPAGSEALLAEATLRFGFHGITAGRWLAERLRNDYDMAADHFDFGCDLERYSLDPAAPRREGIVYYCRPSTPRRAHQLAMLALDLFAERNPEVPLHFFGQPAPRNMPFKATDHGLESPDQLNALYNRCIGGLVLSATNVSLVPYEMLASGCIPIVNDADHNRIVLDNSEVEYAAATPFDLAAALSRVVERPAAERSALAARAAASVQGSSWAESGVIVERTVRGVVERAASATAVAV
jgi:O-antigen biosynthesis protein